MLTGFAAPSGGQVVQLGGGSNSRELYYYPRALRQLTVVGEDVNPGAHGCACVARADVCVSLV
jgi:hypothetical protein